MARSPREVLLEEARDRHKLELARYTEAHTRVGVHLAILGVFALALLRFIDQPPLARGAFVYCLFSVSAAVLGLVTLVVFGFVLAVIWGYGTRFPAPMKEWRDYAEKLRGSYSEEAEPEERVAEELEKRLMENLCDSADDNAAKNRLRSKYIVRASRGLVLAAGAFIVSGGTYLYLSIGQDASTAVHIAGPVEVQLQPRLGGSPMSKKTDAQTPAAPPPTAQKPAAPPPPPPPATVLITDGVDISMVRGGARNK
jgi:cell division septation protein DedD